MSIFKIYSDQSLTVYCADVKNIYHPYPANDDLLQKANEEQRLLDIYDRGKTPFQIIVSSKKDITVTDVKGTGVFCFSTEGVDSAGNPFHRTMPVEAGKPWPFWCLFDADENSDKRLRLNIVSDDGEMIFTEIELNRMIGRQASFEDLDSLIRLDWLNNREGLEPTVPNSFIPITLKNRTIRILGREMTVSPNGFIESVKTYFVGNNSHLSKTARELLESPIGYSVCRDGTPLAFVNKTFSIRRENDTLVSWRSENICDGIKLTVTGIAEFDGTVKQDATIESPTEQSVSVRLICEPKKEFATYFMGLGLTGRKTPEKHVWRWDENKHQDALWIGDINGGIFMRPVDETPVKPFVNIYFHHGPKNLPKNWVNDGKGYFALENRENTRLFYDSGELTVKDPLSFVGELMFSPFKLVDENRLWNTHYFHENLNTECTVEKIKNAKEHGCTHINLHHGNSIYPFLNYPIYDLGSMRQLADLVHENGLKFKPYYTVRELTTRLPELFAFRSLRTEIFPKPTYAQGGISWQNGVDPFLTETFGDEVIPAWKHVFSGGKYDGTTDPTVITNPNSRIANFYVGSISWMIDHIGIDGLYLDDVGYDRTVMRRLRRVLEKKIKQPNIDFHSWNHFEDTYGAGFAHNAVMYMELLPYVDSLWFGESFDYSGNDEAYLLTEVSGLPFGLTGEMLEGDCNVWRGMLFGMTSRYPFYSYYGGPSPTPVWELRKPFVDAEMIGFWEKDQPIYADNSNVLCTIYFDTERNRMLCCFANFASGNATFKISGKLAENVSLFAPKVDGIQEEHIVDLKDEIILPDKGGIFIIAEISEEELK